MKKPPRLDAPITTHPVSEAQVREPARRAESLENEAMSVFFDLFRIKLLQNGAPLRLDDLVREMIFGCVVREKGVHLVPRRM